MLSTKNAITDITMVLLEAKHINLNLQEKVSCILKIQYMMLNEGSVCWEMIA